MTAHPSDHRSRGWLHPDFNRSQTYWRIKRMMWEGDCGTHEAFTQARIEESMGLLHSQMTKDQIQYFVGTTTAYVASLGDSGSTDWRLGRHIEDDIAKLELLGHEDVAKRISLLREGTTLLVGHLMHQNAALQRLKDRVILACLAVGFICAMTIAVLKWA